MLTQRVVKPFDVRHVTVPINTPNTTAETMLKFDTDADFIVVYMGVQIYDQEGSVFALGRKFDEFKLAFKNEQQSSLFQNEAFDASLFRELVLSPKFAGMQINRGTQMLVTASHSGTGASSEMVAPFKVNVMLQGVKVVTEQDYQAAAQQVQQTQMQNAMMQQAQYAQQYGRR